MPIVTTIYPVYLFIFLECKCHSGFFRSGIQSRLTSCQTINRPTSTSYTKQSLKGTRCLPVSNVFFEFCMYSWFSAVHNDFLQNLCEASRAWKRFYMTLDLYCSHEQRSSERSFSLWCFGAVCTQCVKISSQLIFQLG